jgi:hypothetical protein
MPSDNLGGSGLKPSVKFAFEMLTRARQAISRVAYPSLYMIPDKGITLNGISVAVNTKTSGLQVKFLSDGFLVGITVSVESGSQADLASTFLAIQVDGSTDLFTAGNGGQGFVSFAQIQQASSSGGIFRFIAPIKQSIPYQVTLKYFGTSETVSCDLTFWNVNTSNPPLTD